MVDTESASATYIGVHRPARFEIGSRRLGSSCGRSSCR